MNDQNTHSSRVWLAATIAVVAAQAIVFVALVSPWRSGTLRVSAHYPPTPNATGSPAHATLQFSGAIDVNGDNVDDCINTESSTNPAPTPTGPTTCSVPAGDIFRVKVYLDNLSDIPGYAGLNFFLYTGGLTPMDDPNCAPWPDHSSISPVSHNSFNGPSVSWSCQKATGAPLSFYTGLASTIGLRCTPAPSTGNTISLAYGYGTNVIDGNGQTHGTNAARSASLAVNCVSAPTNDSNGNGLPDAFEAGFGGGGISITNPQTANTASATGSAAAGSIITSGPLAVYFPPGTHSADGTNPVQILYGPGPPPAVVIQNANLAGGRKAVEMPIGGGSRVCINDQPAATISSVSGGTCQGLKITIPASGSVSQTATTPDNVSTIYTVTTVSPTVVKVDGLVHSAVGVLAPAVGGIAQLPGVAGTSSAQTDASSGGGGHWAAIGGALAAALLTLGGTVWYIRRRPARRQS